MYLVNSTTDWLKRTCVLIFLIFIGLFSNAQDNSPYSRYGLGDLVPNHNIISRGMGGITAGYLDFQSINFTNPASIATISNTIFDLGGEVDIRTLKSTTSPAKFKSTNTIISYLQVGFPIASKRMMKKGNFMGLSFGLKPLTRISYKIEQRSRITGVDSILTLYEGTGGLNQVSVSTALKLNRLTAGITGAYNFGNKDYSTKIIPINDTVIYYKSNSETHTRFGGVSFTGGLQYDVKLKSKVNRLRLGVYATIQHSLKAKRDYKDETFEYDGDGGTINIDSINIQNDVKGNIISPSTYAAGFTYSTRNWVLGADMELESWSAYRYYGQKDAVRDAWKVRAGAQFFAAKENSAYKYFNFVRYRAGFYYGPDYIKLDHNRPEYAFTFGAGFPLTSAQRIRFGEYVLLNTSVELGGRGNKKSSAVRENIMRFNFGISMNARWFQKPKYD